MAPDPTYTATVAIDFGTARTGYAFAFTAAPTKVYTNKTWPGGPHEGKTLTEVLLKRKDHSLVAFGYEARDKYASLQEEEKEEEEVLYFSTFKMTLHDKEGASRHKVKATNCDEEVPVIRLVAACLRAVKDRAMEELSASTTVPIQCNMVQWVITVPAIWDIAARHVMKEAAVLAGMEDNSVSIALEPEAASIWCLKNQLEMSSLHEHPFMVVDAGGGTVDITIHKMRTDGKLTEIHRPSGGCWGATTVNNEFAKMLETLFGIQQTTSMRNSELWFEVMDSFENVKLKFQDGPNEPKVKNINIGVLGGGADVQRISEYNTPDTAIQLLGGILRIPTPTFRKFFEPSLDSITNHIKELLANDSCKALKHLFLVGGYAESPALVNAIKSCVGEGVRVICPPRPGSAVVIGAVQYGLNPEFISSRIAVRTIGVSCSALWDESLHVGGASFYDEDGELRCSNVFETYITAGSHIDTTSTVSHDFTPARRSQTCVIFPVCASHKAHVSFANDPGMAEIGKLEFVLPKESLALPKHKRGVTVSMKFGGTVFTVTATCKTTGEVLTSKFSFPLDP